MTVAFYLDEDTMDSDLIEATRLHRLDVISATEAGMLQRTDEDHLAYAAKSGRVLYSFNVRDFCRLHGGWLRCGQSHSGILLAHQWRRYSMGTQARALVNLAAALEPADMRDRLEYLAPWT